MSDLVCRICNEPILFPKDKKQSAHEVCVYAEDTARTFENLNRNHHKNNAMTILRKIAAAVVGMKVEAPGALSKEEVRDEIILVHEQLKELLEDTFNIDLGEDKSFIIAQRFELLQPFLRLETIVKETIDSRSKVYNYLELSSPVYTSARRNGHMPKTWDAKMRRKGINPMYVRSGNGSAFLTGAERDLMNDE